MEAEELIKYFRSIGLEVYTTTKARGHQGFYLRRRIDISKNISQSRISRIIQTGLDRIKKDLAKQGII